MTFEAGERMAVWEWASHHKSLVSIIEAEPAKVRIEFGPPSRRRREWTTYNKLTCRSDGLPITFTMIVDGVELLDKLQEGTSMQDTKTGLFYEVKDESEAVKAESKGIPVFRVGEILTIKGARVRVRSIGRKVLTLEGLPGSQFAVEDKLTEKQLDIEKKMRMGV